MGGMPSMRPATASDPDGADGWRYHDLGEVAPDLAFQLVKEYGEVWLPAAELPEARLSEVRDTLKLDVADEWEDAGAGTKRLRLTSWYTGETSWLHDWEGDVESAVEWIRSQAELRAVWVRYERFRYGSTFWDPEGDYRREERTPEELRAWLKDDAKRHPLD